MRPTRSFLSTLKAATLKGSTLTTATLALAMLAGTGSALAQYYGPPPVQHWRAERGARIEQRGFQDGAVGAERDFQNHRRVDVNNRDEYRNPSFIPSWAQHEYREGFRRGYYERAHQIYGEGFRDRR
jgi:hypothetical protein